MKMSRPQRVQGSFHAQKHNLEARPAQGPSDHSEPHVEQEGLTVIELELSRSEIGDTLNLMPGAIVARLRDRSQVPAIGIVMRIAQGPAILTGVSASEDRLVLPGGCSALYLSGYAAPTSDLSRADQVCLAVAFSSEVCDDIDHLEIDGLPN